MGVSPSVQQAEIFGMGTQVAIVISPLRGHKILKGKLGEKILSAQSFYRP